MVVFPRPVAPSGLGWVLAIVALILAFLTIIGAIAVPLIWLIVILALAVVL